VLLVPTTPEWTATVVQPVALDCELLVKPTFLSNGRSGTMQLRSHTRKDEQINNY